MKPMRIICLLATILGGALMWTPDDEIPVVPFPGADLTVEFRGRAPHNDTYELDVMIPRRSRRTIS